MNATDVIEIELYRLAGYFADKDGLSWYDTGVRADDGRRIFCDGLVWAVRAGVSRKPIDVNPTELGADAGRVTP